MSDGFSPLGSVAAPGAAGLVVHKKNKWDCRGVHPTEKTTWEPRNGYSNDVPWICEKSREVYTIGIPGIPDRSVAKNLDWRTLGVDGPVLHLTHQGDPPLLECGVTWSDLGLIRSHMVCWKILHLYRSFSYQLPFMKGFQLPCLITR